MANNTKYGYLISPAPQFLDTNGKPISGGKLKVYIAGTTTKATTYSDWNLTKNTWPIVLDSMGTCQAIVSSANLYKFVLESAEGEEPLVTRDNVAVAYANVDITGIGSEVVNSDGSVDVTATTDPDTGRTTYDVSVKDTVQDLEGLITDETERAKTAEKAAKTEIVAGDNITVTKTVGADGQDVYTIDGEDEDNLVEDVRVNGTSVVTDKVANIYVPVAGTASPLMDGAASAGASGKFASEDHVHPSDTSREAVANKTTVVLGTSESKYPTDKAVADFVNSSVATNTANYISNDGEPFTSVAQLEAYSGTVTNNDYAFVTGTDSAGNTYYDRYKATVSGSTVTWALEYRLNNSSFTAAQWAAINSGITAALVGKIHEHANKAVLDGITATDVSNWNNKLDKDGNGSDVTVGFTEATSRTNIATGSKLSTLFGQIRKWFSDLKALAFKDKVGASDVESGTYNIDISGNAATASSTDRAAQTYVLEARGETNATYRKLGRLLTSIGGCRDVIMLVTSPDSLYGNIPATYLVSVTNRINNPLVRYVSLGPLQNLPERMASFGYVRYDNKDIELAMFCPGWGGFIKVQILTSHAFTLDENFTSFDGTGYVVGDRYTNVLFLGSNAIGSSSIPTYVNANGVLQPCDPSSMSVGNAATASEAASGSTLESKINSKQDDLGITSSGSSTKFLNEQGEWVTVTTPDVSGKADKVSGATEGDVATLDANGNLVDSGKTLGASVPADAAFTDDKVAQMKADSSVTAYPLLMAGTTDPRGNATVTRYDSGVTLDPSTNTIAANISGNAATATTATSATTASATSSGAIQGGDDLNSYNVANRTYLCSAANAPTVTNKPSGASGSFELEVIRGTGSSCVQVYYSRDDVNFNYIRKLTGINNGTWTSWVKLIDSDDTVANATTADKLGSANVGLPCMPIYLFAGTPMSIEDYFFSPLAEPSTRNLSAETTLNAVGGGKYVYNVKTSNTFNLTLASTASAPIAFAVRLKCTANCPNVYVTYNDAVERATLTRHVYLTSGKMVDMCFTYYYGYFHLVSLVEYP